MAAFHDAVAREELMRLNSYFSWNSFDFSLQAFLGEAESIHELFEFGDAADHARAVDDQLADGIHHTVEAFERDAHGFAWKPPG